MKQMIRAASTFALCALSLQANAQLPFATIDFVNINNIKASVLVHGDMWWDPTTQMSQCFYPATTTKNISFAGALWMSGYDAGSQLHIASQMYRQNGNDYWPGPLDASDTLTYATSTDWAKIWKINRTQIDTFLGLTTHTTTNTPAPILQWPGKGNTYARGNAGAALTITQNMAPFVDLNSNGIYEPLLGEYPSIKGDQALWWVFSDNGPTHTESRGKPLGVEVHTMAYAYQRGTLVDDIILYEYSVINKSANTYTNFRIGQFADMDLGTPTDDYIGFDSVHRMGYVYNGQSTDAIYGANIPIAGVSMIVLPGDAFPAYVPAGSFGYFNNDSTSAVGNPNIDTQFNNYLRSKTKTGVHFSNDFTVAGTHTVGYGSGSHTNYVFPGDPSVNTQWSECSSSNIYGDRRFIITSNDFTLAPGATEQVVMALVTTPAGLNACGDAGLGLAGIHTIADTAWNLFFHPLPPNSVADVNDDRNIRIYPNPAHSQLNIEVIGVTGTYSSSESIAIYNTLGQQMHIVINKQQTVRTIDLAAFPAGLYYIRYVSSGVEKTASFIKE